MLLWILPFALGLVAGLRTLVPPAVLSWAAYLRVLDLTATPVFFLGHLASPLVFTALAAVEIVSDKLPATPSRLTPFQLGSRLASGAFSGGVLALAVSGDPVSGAVLGLCGAGVGAFAGARGRAALARALGRDAPAALAEDALAAAAGVLIVLVAAR